MHDKPPFPQPLLGTFPELLVVAGLPISGDHSHQAWLSSSGTNSSILMIGQLKLTSRGSFPRGKRRERSYPFFPPVGGLTAAWLHLQVFHQLLQHLTLLILQSPHHSPNIPSAEKWSQPKECAAGHTASPFHHLPLPNLMVNPLALGVGVSWEWMLNVGEWCMGRGGLWDVPGRWRGGVRGWRGWVVLGEIGGRGLLHLPGIRTLVWAAEWSVGVTTAYDRAYMPARAVVS